MANSASGIEKLSISIFWQKRYKEMETKLSMSVMQNLLATCWFYIIIMCGTGIKTFFILPSICYIDVFSFSYFSLLKSRFWHRNKMVSWFITLMNLQTVFLEFSWEIDVNWLFVILKSYVKVSFKERNNNNNQDVRFNGHSRPHSKCNRWKCELPRHLHDHGYGFNKDLKVSVLDKVNGGYELQAFKEVEWISRFSILQ